MLGAVRSDRARPMRLRLPIVLCAAALSLVPVVAAIDAAVPDATASAPPAARAISPIGPSPWSDAWLLAHGDTYLDDDGANARRVALTRSLHNADNLYARQRLRAYGLGDAGWDALPPWNPRARVLAAGDVDTPVADTTPQSTDAPALWDGIRPQTMAQWVALGRRVFLTYPLRAEPAAAHAIALGATAAIGLHRDADADAGLYPGLVAYRDIDGADAIGITCALCHSAVEDGTLVLGRARRDFDFGAMRLAWHADTGEPVDPRLRARMASWGPGRADITEDDDADPVAIPDLWRLRELRHLTQAATIVQDDRDGAATPLGLAIRQETQFIHAGGERTRPPRELTWALTMFLYSLEPPPRDVPQEDPRLDRGRRVFDDHCRGCHGDASGSGAAVAAVRVGTDPALAQGTSRGTGFYRPAPLVAVADAAPYLHDGSVGTLEDLFDPARLRVGFDRGARASGPVLGHAYGTRLSAHDRDALVAWLRTL